MQSSNHVDRDRRQDPGLVQLNYPPTFRSRRFQKLQEVAGIPKISRNFHHNIRAACFGTFVARNRPNRPGEQVMSTISATAVSAPKPLYQSLFVQVLVALLLGVALGVAVPDFAVELKILSDAFLKLISMIVAPIVFCVVVHGIAGAGDLKKVGRVGVKALVYFEVMTTVALVVGLLLAYLFGPGHGMNIDTSTLDPKALSSYADNAHKLQGGGIGSFLMNIIPSTSFDALARNDVLQVLFFAILFGVSLALVGERAQPVADLIDRVSTV